MDKEKLLKMTALDMLSAYLDLKNSKTLKGEECKDCEYCEGCESCRDCKNCEYCECCKDCEDCKYCKECKACDDCRFCHNLISKRYCILNVQFTKEEYESFINKLKGVNFG